MNLSFILISHLSIISSTFASNFIKSNNDNDDVFNDNFVDNSTDDQFLWPFTVFPQEQDHNSDLELVEYYIENEMLTKIEELIDGDPNILFCPIKNGLYLVHMAVKAGYYDLLSNLILIHRCFVNTMTEDGYDMDPLHLATADFSNHTEDIMSLLIKSGAVIDSLDAFGETPLCHAIIHDNVLAAEILLKNGANPNHYIRNPHSLSKAQLVVNMAVISDSLEILDLLIKRGADLTLTDTSMLNPLHTAVLNNREEILRRLREFFPGNNPCPNMIPCAAPDSVSSQLFNIYLTPESFLLEFEYFEIEDYDENETEDYID